MATEPSKIPGEDVPSSSHPDQVKGGFLSFMLGISGLQIGITGLLAPGLLAKLFGIDTKASPGSIVIIRSASVRDVAIGFGILRARSRSARIGFIEARALCDLVDAVVCLIGTLKGGPRRSLLLLTGSALFSAAVSGHVASRLRKAAR